MSPTVFLNVSLWAHIALFAATNQVQFSIFFFYSTLAYVQVFFGRRIWMLC